MDGKIVAIAVVAILAGVGIGAGGAYVAFSDDAPSGEETYSFYLYFADGDERNGWYQADGNGALDGFNRAMENAEFEWEASSWGYVDKIDGVGDSGWYCCQYLYENTDEAAAQGSVAYPSESYGTLQYSNGWKSISGYDWEGGMKLGQFSGNIYFLSAYKADYSAESPVSYSAESPVSVSTWMNSGPFAAA